MILLGYTGLRLTLQKMSRADFTCSKCEKTGKPKRAGFQYRLGINLAFSIISFGLWLFVWIPWLVIAKSIGKPKYQCRHCNAPIQKYPLGEYSCEHCNQMVLPQAGSFSRSYFNNLLLTVISLGAWLWLWGIWFILGRRTKKCPACGGLFESLEKPSYGYKAISSPWGRGVSALVLFGLPIWLSVLLLSQTQDVIDSSISPDNFKLDLRIGEGYAVLADLNYEIPTTNIFSDFVWISSLGLVVLVVASELAKQRWNRVLIGRWYYAWALLVISSVISNLFSFDIQRAKEDVTQQAFSQHQDYLRGKFHDACADAGVESPIVEFALDASASGDRGYSLNRRNLEEEGQSFSEFSESSVGYRNGFVCATPDVLDELEDAISSEKNRETFCSWKIQDNYYSITKPVVEGSRYTTTEREKGLSSLGIECDALDSRILNEFLAGSFQSG